MTAYRCPGRYAVIGCKLKQNDKAATVVQHLCKSCRTCFMFLLHVCFILLVIAPLRSTHSLNDLAMVAVQ